MTEPLRPASYGESPKDAGFGPKIPWAALLFLITVIGGGLGFYLYREAQKRHDARAQIHQIFQDGVGPVAPRLREFREGVERLVLEARAIDDGARWAKPGFAIHDLHELRGVYLRIREEDAADVPSLRVAAQAMVPDAVGRCLGITPVALRGFYERGSFVNEAFLEEVEATDDVMRLRVMEERLRGHLRRDLPLLSSMAESDYFLLVVERGASRHQGAVDFYLWDIRQRGQELLLRTRAEARGALFTARIGLPGSPRTKIPPISPRRAGAQDCSLAAQVREATGLAPIEFGSEIAEPEPEPAEAPGADEPATDDDTANVAEEGSAAEAEANVAEES